MDWQALRSLFPVTRRWAYFDHAAVAPLSGPAERAFVDWASDLAENGDVHDPRWVARVEDVRRLAARLMDAEPEDVGFIKNTSEGIGILAEGFPWRAGDNIVTAAEEYPANIYPWMNLADRKVDVRLVPSRENRISIDDMREAIDGRTRIVSLSFVEYASGFRNDLDALGEVCRAKGVCFCVDAIQGLGVSPLSVRKSPIDVLAADGHKWLLGAEGAGLFYMRREWVDRLHPVGIGWNSMVNSRDFSRLDFRLKPGPGRWESGSLNVAGIMALGASLELLLGIGTEEIARRVIELTDYLCEKALAAGFKVFSSRLAAEKSGIVSLTGFAGDARSLVRRCRAENVVINHRAGRVRVSPHCYNTFQEIDRLIELLR